jgi:prepilin-type N-terminal cleavage/methylation domain-containing protein
MRKKGFTLVEILVSLLILGMGIVGLYNLFPLALQSLSYSRLLNEVSYLAQRKMEELKRKEINIPFGKIEGKEDNLHWSIFTQSLKLAEDLELVHVELDIDFEFQGKSQKQKFITYLLKD